MRKAFDEQMKQLHEKLTEMGAHCEQAIDLAAKALTTGDPALAEQVLSTDGEIDQAERDIEALCLKLLLHQQPVARDLRQISAALKMITDMERIGDQASDIAQMLPYVRQQKWQDSERISGMASETIRMVTGSVDAYVRQDLALASAVIEQDDVVDDYFNQVKQSLIRRMLEHPEEAELALDLMMIAKYFERIGDHATNIAEWVMFSLTGRHESP
ncbi:MAG: phosphate signaling complex protein PhoU [Firmicutes bacterium]|nr:phosphate signaling complex protein PhoU [Bacillota bacterium]